MVSGSPWPSRGKLAWVKVKRKSMGDLISSKRVCEGYI